MAKLLPIVSGICLLAVLGFQRESFASATCKSLFQADTKSFGENQPLFSLATNIEPNLVSTRSRIAISRMKDVLQKTRLDEYLELTGNSSALSISAVRQGIS